MGLAALLKEPSLTSEQGDLKEAFFEATGYSSDDLLSFNFGTRIFLTRNGGKYRVDPDGIAHLAGPAPDVADRYLD
jgi:hypothetical protein